MLRSIAYCTVVTLLIGYSLGYSASEDARIIAEYKKEVQRNHAKIARQLVHQANWASFGTVSTNTKTLGFPMVNIVSVDDSTKDGQSNGKIHFLLTDLDFTGPDWRASNKVTLLFSDEQNKNCAKRGEDPMEPTCPRIMISGKVVEMNVNGSGYNDTLTAFEKRHPAAAHWINAHTFYLCELDIQHIFVLDFYGGPHEVTPEQYYSANLDNAI